ncbi:hypothetical protein SLEP1_g44495 [Rubroshorea leprosula]|uniref:Pyruvate dehydrogenase (acetyl-transferring) n=1 Tax=Rubroshorea leprosula TaxID=152421 RepID=A0AAV5LHG5_9ROSI|nr:hypothetical protein SLEP1_g44495 [Rubroshorea leprosula]
MTIGEALNSALDEEMSTDPNVFLMGEEVARLVNFRVHSRFLAEVGSQESS